MINFSKSSLNSTFLDFFFGLSKALFFLRFCDRPTIADPEGTDGGISDVDGIESRLSNEGAAEMDGAGEGLVQDDVRMDEDVDEVDADSDVWGLEETGFKAKNNSAAIESSSGEIVKSSFSIFKRE